MGPGWMTGLSELIGMLDSLREGSMAGASQVDRLVDKDDYKDMYLNMFVQVRDEYRTDFDSGRGGYGKIVQQKLDVPEFLTA